LDELIDALDTLLDKHTNEEVLDAIAMAVYHLSSSPASAQRVETVKSRVRFLFSIRK